MTDLAMTDCETTSLAPPWLFEGRRPWEVTVQHVAADGTAQADPWTYIVRDVNLNHASNEALNLGGFYRRHPMYCRDAHLPPRTVMLSEREVAARVAEHTRGRVLVAANPGFDTETLSAMLHRNHMHPVNPWTYSPHDVKAAACGVLGIPPGPGTDTLARALGIDPESYPRHSSAGDVALLLDMYRAVLARAPKAVAA